MLDHAISGGTVVDGSATSPGRRADVGIKDGRIVAVCRARPARRAGGADDRRHRPGGDAGVRRPPHPLRRPALLGSAGDAVELARRHQRHRRQLRLHPGAAARARRRLHPPDDGPGRGHAPRGAGAGAAVEVGDLRRVPRRSGRFAGGERRVHGGPLRAPPLRAGRGLRAGVHAGRAASRSAGSCASRWPPAGWACPPPGRPRTSTATASRCRAAMRPRTRSWPSVRSSPSSRAPRWRPSCRAASAASATRRSSCWPA